MKKTPDSDISEPELLKAMIARGRNVSLQTFANWRRSGLLPPLANRGRGQGKGKHYYWSQRDILSHALHVYDLLKADAARDTVVLILWLSGFDVPIEQFRRAWLHRIKYDRVWKVQRQSAPWAEEGPRSRLALKGNSKNLESFSRDARALLNLTLAVSATLAPKYSP